MVKNVACGGMDEKTWDGDRCRSVVGDAIWRAVFVFASLLGGRWAERKEGATPAETGGGRGDRWSGGVLLFAETIPGPPLSNHAQGWGKDLRELAQRRENALLTLIHGTTSRGSSWHGTCVSCAWRQRLWLRPCILKFLSNQS